MRIEVSKMRVDKKPWQDPVIRCLKALSLLECPGHSQQHVSKTLDLQAMQALWDSEARLRGVVGQCRQRNHHDERAWHR